MVRLGTGCTAGNGYYNMDNYGLALLPAAVHLWMVRPDTVVTAWMGNICYYVSNMASGDQWMVGTRLQW